MHLEELLETLNTRKIPKICFDGELQVAAFEVVSARYAIYSRIPNLMNNTLAEFSYAGSIEVIVYEDIYRFAASDDSMHFDKQIVLPWSMYHYNLNGSAGEGRHPVRPFIRVQIKNQPEGDEFDRLREELFAKRLQKEFDHRKWELADIYQRFPKQEYQEIRLFLK